MMMDPQNRNDERLFGTLLASKPARARSPLALSIAVILHVVVLGLLVVLSRPFIPSLAHKLFEQVTIIVPEEEVPTIRLGAPRGMPAAPRAERKKEAEPGGGGPVTFTPGPVTGIPEAVPGPETLEPSDDGGAGGGGTLAERLRPRTIDPRLSGSATYTLPPDATPAAAVRARIASSLSVYNDSVAAEAEARRKALDWTIKTKDGKQWGIGPDGKIHLGDITIPVPVAFSTPPGKRDEVNARNRDFAEIERQANSEIGRQSFNQRVKAIRARKEKEREEKKKAPEEAPITQK